MYIAYAANGGGVCVCVCVASFKRQHKSSAAAVFLVIVYHAYRYTPCVCLHTYIYRQTADAGAYNAYAMCASPASNININILKQHQQLVEHILRPPNDAENQFKFNLMYSQIKYASHSLPLCISLSFSISLATLELQVTELENVTFGTF